MSSHHRASASRQPQTLAPNSSWMDNPMMSQPGRAWSSLTPVQSLVERACDPMLMEPNYAINLELAEYIQQKKANTPREAAMESVKMINNRNPHVAMLGLNLLDTLVKSAGYPFHLQISTKEFLNEFVRRFPERPPVMMGPVMGRTLELIHEWKNTICVTSKHKEDLVHIRDMHRLLSYKGYRFKSFDATRAMASANPTENLKSPEELEDEDRAAKSAKLQELIRRGTPKDLAAAQELMKALSGFEPEKQPDYADQTKTELEKVQQKAILLNDMLNNVKEGEKIGLEGDAYEQVASVCKQARPKIQKWIGEAGEDNMELMDRLLLMNDLINNVLNRYSACRKGDWKKAAEIDATLNPHHKPPDLISFDAFADDSDLNALSITPDVTPLAANNNTAPAPSASGGLPLDLFGSSVTAPTAGPARTSQKQRVDPMAFFNTPNQGSSNAAGPSPLAAGSGIGLGSFAGPGGNVYAPQPQVTAQPSWMGLSNAGFAPSPSASRPASQGPSGGISLPLTPGIATPAAPGLSNSAQSQAGPPKKDPFADLANLF